MLILVILSVGRELMLLLFFDVVVGKRKERSQSSSNSGEKVRILALFSPRISRCSALASEFPTCCSRLLCCTCNTC